jgi:hypothetical protein
MLLMFLPDNWFISLPSPIPEQSAFGDIELTIILFDVRRIGTSRAADEMKARAMRISALTFFNNDMFLSLSYHYKKQYKVIS